MTAAISLTVLMADVTFYTGEFTVKETPYIISAVSNNILSNKLVQVGDEITVTGKGLTPDGTVTIGGIKVEPTFNGNNEFKASIPAGFTGGKVVLTYEAISVPVTSDDELILLTEGMDITEFVLAKLSATFYTESRNFRNR